MEMLDHIRSQYRFYKQSTYKLLRKKKLDLVDWLAAMQNKDLPADEICLLACARMVGIHISVDYNTGCWTTFEEIVTNHDYITEVSDMHFVYKGSCRYNLLCRNYELKTIGRKLLDHKLYKMELIQPFSIVLTRIEDQLDNTKNTEQATSDSDNTELYYQSDTPTSKCQTMSDSEGTEIYKLPTNFEAKTYQVDKQKEKTQQKTQQEEQKIKPIKIQTRMQKAIIYM